jgi:peptidoglycan/xylan/chitin deacetylase (PgdA/CDA1 family)
MGLRTRQAMTVGNHSYNHPQVPPFDQLPTPLATDEIALGAQSLRRAGAGPMLFRPPGGSFSPQLVARDSRVAYAFTFGGLCSVVLGCARCVMPSMPLTLAPSLAAPQSYPGEPGSVIRSQWRRRCRMTG